MAAVSLVTFGVGLSPLPRRPLHNARALALLLKFGWFAARARAASAPKSARGSAGGVLGPLASSWAGQKQSTNHKNQLKAAPRRIGRNMILTQCAVCATELGLTLGKKCGRCSTPQGRGQVLGLHAC